ncbi:hypothetical protein Hanom_Chr04g00324001 [Helianthus anomalus]
MNIWPAPCGRISRPVWVYFQPSLYNCTPTLVRQKAIQSYRSENPSQARAYFSAPCG